MFVLAPSDHPAITDPQVKARTAVAKCIGELLPGSHTTLDQAICTPQQQLCIQTPVKTHPMK